MFKGEADMLCIECDAADDILHVIANAMKAFDESVSFRAS
jgi:hypothetical protein